MEGYKDFVRTLQQTDDPLLSNVAMSLNSTYSSPMVYAGNWQNLSVRCLANASLAGGGYRITLNFYGDQAGTQLVQTFSWDISDQTPLYDDVSVIAPWCQLVQNGSSAPAGRTATVILSPFNGGGTNRKSNRVNGLMNVASLTVNAGSSRTQIPAYETSGACTISCSVSGTNRNAEVYLQAADVTGATTIIWGHTFATADLQDYVVTDLWLPPQYFDAHCLNHNGANNCVWNLYIGAAT